jgi:retinol dehydrogenase-12
MLLRTNCTRPFLFTRLLHPILVTTAASSPHPGTVRVLWVASVVVNLQSPKGGLDVSNLDYKKKDERSAVRYTISKAGNLFIRSEWSKRDSTNQVVHLIGLTIFAVSSLC